MAADLGIFRSCCQCRFRSKNARVSSGVLSPCLLLPRGRPFSVAQLFLRSRSCSPALFLGSGSPNMKSHAFYVGASENKGHPLFGKDPKFFKVRYFGKPPRKVGEKGGPKRAFPKGPLRKKEHPCGRDPARAPSQSRPWPTPRPTPRVLRLGLARKEHFLRVRKGNFHGLARKSSLGIIRADGAQNGATRGQTGTRIMRADRCQLHRRGPKRVKAGAGAKRGQSGERAAKNILAVCQLRLRGPRRPRSPRSPPRLPWLPRRPLWRAPGHRRRRSAARRAHLYLRARSVNADTLSFVPGHEAGRPKTGREGCKVSSPRSLWPPSVKREAAQVHGRGRAPEGRSAGSGAGPSERSRRWPFSPALSSLRPRERQARPGAQELVPGISHPRLFMQVFLAF